MYHVGNCIYLHPTYYIVYIQKYIIENYTYVCSLFINTKKKFSNIHTWGVLA